MRVRVLIAEGHPAARSALRLLLEEESIVDVVGEVCRAADLPEQVGALDVHTLLLDWALPGLHGGRMLGVLRRCHPHLRVIALSGRPEVGEEALASGADAVAGKGEPPKKLLGLLRTDPEKEIDSEAAAPTSQMTRWATGQMTGR